MWVTLAFLAAISAALVAIFGKLGLQKIDSTLATTIRSVIMALFLLGLSGVMGKWKGFSIGVMGTREWLFIIGAGIAGALSWLFYFGAMATGEASKVATIDRLSLVFVLILAAMFLKEPLTLRVILGGILVVAGALLITLK